MRNILKKIGFKFLLPIDEAFFFYQFQVTTLKKIMAVLRKLILPNVLNSNSQRQNGNQGHSCRSSNSQFVAHVTDLTEVSLDRSFCHLKL